MKIKKVLAALMCVSMVFSGSMSVCAMEETIDIPEEITESLTEEVEVVSDTEEVVSASDQGDSWVCEEYADEEAETVARYYHFDDDDDDDFDDDDDDDYDDDDDFDDDDDDDYDDDDDFDDDDDYGDEDEYELTDDSGDDHIYLSAGEKAQLYLRDYYEDEFPYYDDLTWGSSDTKVAIVNAQGVVTAVGEGTAIITVSYKGQSWICEVEVEGVDYDEFEINPEELLLFVGKKSRLELWDDGGDTVPYNTKGLSWKSSDTKIVTVDNKGYVTGIRSGVGIITVSLNGYSWTCKVTVKKQPAIKLSETSKTMGFNEKFQLKLLNAPRQVKWSSSDNSIATVSKGVVKTKKKTGKVTITATVGGKAYKCNIMVSSGKKGRR